MATAHRSRFLELAALSSLQHKRFTPRHRVEGGYSGRHTSRTLGGSGEFADYREYAAGEDLRRLDWRVLARTGRAYIKVFQDETNLLCTLMIDASGSMRFGARSKRDLTGSKLEYAQYLTTALSHVICAQRDQVGLAIASSGLQEFFPPAGTGRQLSVIQEYIENIATRPKTDLAEALQQLFSRVHHRGVLIIASDFLVNDLNDVFARLRLFRHRRWEVILLHLVHPDEERLPDGLAYRFEGLEDEGAITCSMDEIRNEYREKFESHLAIVRSLAVAEGCDYRLVSTAVPYLQTLGSFLVERTG